MLKSALLAALGLSLIGLLSVAPAGAQVTIGQRQPNASDVPGDDSVRGTAATATATAITAKKTSKKRSRARRVQSNVDVIVKTPNICSNCNQ
jgi:hypothetical protein